ncbi:beta-lactamase family protein [Eubacteriales bacterium OttesenSCG-928-A19]|nr:beta-lactamase family protein [Eubacteriales bacterium OttesenSCG-928-A19]
MKHDIFDGFRQTVAEKHMNAYGIHVHIDGQGSMEHRFRSDERTHLFSGSKAFTSMAVGIAASEGLLSLEDSALSFFPALREEAAPGAERITVRDLLHMCAGHAEPLFSTEESSQRMDDDWASVFFRMPQAYAPGSAFLYDNGCSYMLSRIIGAASGQTLLDYLMPRLFAPLDIHNPQWHTCPRGHTLGAFGLYLKTEEFARLGMLLLRKGRWEDRQLVPPDYLRRAIEDTVPTEGFTDAETNVGYGYQLWPCTRPGAFRADGKYGQYSIVVPDIGAVVTITAHHEGNAFDLIRAVWTDIVPRL